MASRYDYSTKTVTEMSYTDLKGLSPKQLRTAARQLLDVAAKRYKRGDKKWGDVGAIGTWSEYTKGTGKLSIKGKSEAELIRITQMAQQFLTSKTSTEKGRREVKKKFEKTIGQGLTVDQYKQLWSTYDKVEEMGRNGFIEGYYAINYKTIIKDIVTEIKSGNADTYISSATKRIDAMYKEYRINQREENLTSEDFEALSGMDFADLLF